MNLPEVVNLLKEIVDHCASLEGNDFLVAPSKVPESSVDGYEIHMTGNFEDTTKKYLSDLALSKKLAIIQHPNSIMMYKAKENRKLNTAKPPAS